MAMDIVVQQELPTQEPQRSTAEVIEAAEAVVKARPSDADLIAHAEEVFKYGERKLKPSLDSNRKSQRPLCAGCAFGIRTETTPKLLEGLPYHPNCLKAKLNPEFALKTSPKYLAAAVPLMSPRAIAAYANGSAEEPESDTEGSSPSVSPTAEESTTVEDSTTELVANATKRSQRKSR